MLSDLLKDVPRLMSEEPREILRFFVDIKAIYDLNLVPDKVLNHSELTIPVLNVRRLSFLE